MAHLTLRRSWLVSREPLSVVYLAIIYAVLTIALVAEWGRIVRVIAIDVTQSGSDAAAPYLSSAPGELP